MASDRLRERKNRSIVVLDSSAAMMPFEFLVDLEKGLTRLLGKFRIIVSSSVLNELIFLTEKGSGRKKRFAKPALDLIKDYEVVDTNKNADDSVLELAVKMDGIVFTNDKELRKRAKKNSLKTIYLRGKNRLVLE